MIVCPSCRGEKSSLCFVDYIGGRGGVERVACSTCKGTGEITEEHLAKIEAGDELRKARRERRESMRDTAKRLGIDWIIYSKMENGQL